MCLNHENTHIINSTPLPTFLFLSHTHLSHHCQKKSCDIIAKAFQLPNQNQSPTESLFFVISLTGRETERSVSVPLIRQAWVIKKEIKRSVWERPREPPLICSQLIVLAFYCFLLGWQIIEQPASKKRVQVLSWSWNSFEICFRWHWYRRVVLENHCQ